MMQENLIKLYRESFKNNKELPALTDYFKQESFSYLEMAKEIAKIHLLFEQCGIEKGDKIALIGRNNTRWVITYIATITYGAVIVPMLQDFAANDVNHIIKHSESKLLFLGDNFWDIIEESEQKDIKAAFSLTDGSCIYEQEGDSIKQFQNNMHKHFNKRYPNGFTEEDIDYPEVPNDALCLLNYTSGTTGFSKGVMLTVNALTGNVVFINMHKVHTRGSRGLSFLPLAHAYGCAVDMLAPLAVGAHITLLGKMPAPKILLEAMAVVKPNVVVTVPLLVEKIVRKQVFPKIKGFTAVATKIPVLDSVIYTSIRRKLLDAFGGEMSHVIIGGAPFNAEVEDFLVKIKFPFCVGYGMTECAPLISYEDPDKFKPTSCGRILEPIMELRIASEDPYTIPGEIQTRGENVMIGYYKNEKATEDVFTQDGWLRTGDMGTTDEIGTIYIRGRCKTMLLGSNGQNIYPEEIEAKLNNMPCVMESLVIEREGRLIAMVVPDYEQADSEGIKQDRLAELMKDNLKELNAQLAAYEKVADIVLYPTEFEKTPKRSIKRYLYTN
jgi:long-chain acyl-CoA synthetase